MITPGTKESIERLKAEKKVRECRDRYLVYFAYTTLKIKPGGYKEDPRPYIITVYDVMSSNSLDSVKEHKDLLLSLMTEDNSYALVIIDRLEAKILKRIMKKVKFETVFEKNNITSKKAQSAVKFEYLKYLKEVSPSLSYTWDNKLAELDFFFRGPSEVPEDYKWDTGEYEGWLQYRWGDGLNAIDRDEQE